MKTLILRLTVGMVVFLMAQVATARTWRMVVIPGARCGSGTPYKVFVSQRSSEKLAVEFMGGGACWNASTCYGRNLMTWMFPVPYMENFSQVTKDSDRNELKDHSMVYLPLCTGDVFAGNHVTRYEYGLKAHHVGYTNVQKAFAYLKRRKIVNFDEVKELVAWGASAGAIGALTHTATLDQFVPPTAKKLLIADSPGLHFGPTFWKKFSKKMMADFKKSFGAIGMEIDEDDGLIAKKMGPVLDHLGHWQVAIMQAASDGTMSAKFGNETPDEHKANVLGPYGIIEVSKGHSNIDLFIPDTSNHTFMGFSDLSGIKDSTGITAYDFFMGEYRKFAGK